MNRKNTTAAQRGQKKPASPKRKAIGQGWCTTDDDERERRRQRAEQENLRVRANEPASPPFGTYTVQSEPGRTYKVELRALDEAINACDCPDYEVNGLGTCKHIEAVLRQRRRSRPAKRTCTEIYLDRRDQYGEGAKVRVLWAQGLRANNKVRRVVEPFFSTAGELLGDPLDALPALERAAVETGLGRDRLRISSQIARWQERLRRSRKREAERRHFMVDVAAGKRDLDVVRHPLYDYQREGMLHLAFGERAILADEMGLGKTVQAVAACELLRRLRGIERVLVVSPVSLKTEWAEQIERFTDRSAQIIQGRRPARLRQYRQPAFFNLANYEQVLADRETLQRQLMPDCIILDEAQRIKNWQTKTADAVKRLQSPYLFVLTGTPLENRIDEIYSIAQAIDPHLFGPLFRFNREFYQLDDKGRPQGYKNLDALHRRLRPVLLRRRKEDVEGELPERTVNTYFVEMHTEQRARYEEHSARVARLMQAAQRRPLSPEEFQRLQQQLACMRMICDSPYILDPECRVAPKLTELQSLLEELLDATDNKILIFSEWTRMLDLVREHAEAAGIGHAVHTGQVQQKHRRAEIRRFQEDPQCRLFLTSDAGATGLNLQAANVVINLDLPWNPAKLEQRIARAWRKHQQRPVQVINLVCTDSIEHRILHLLEQKSALADGVLDGDGEAEMKLPSGGQALVERLNDLMGTRSEAPALEANETGPRTLDLDDLPDELEARHPDGLERLAAFDGGGSSSTTLLAVASGDVATRREELQGLLAQTDSAATAEVIDPETMATIERLVDAGVLQMNAHRTLHESPATGRQAEERRRARLARARERLAEAERRLNMARLLADGGFGPEAVAPLHEAAEGALASLAEAMEDHADAPIPLERVRQTLGPEIELTAEEITMIAALREGPGVAQAQWPVTIARVIDRIGERFNQWSLAQG